MKCKQILLFGLATITLLGGATIQSDTIQAQPSYLQTEDGQSVSVQMRVESNKEGAQLVLDTAGKELTSIEATYSIEGKPEVEHSLVFEKNEEGDYNASIASEDIVDNTTVLVNLSAQTPEGENVLLTDFPIVWSKDVDNQNGETEESNEEVGDSSSSSTVVSSSSEETSEATSSVDSATTNETLEKSKTVVGQTETQVGSKESSRNQTLYRLYNKDLKTHHYTLDQNEYKVLATRGWRQEGVAWLTAPQVGDRVYRLYHPGLRVHLYTKDANEYKRLGSSSWKQEGIAFYSYGNVPIYRLYNSKLKRHLYTNDANEYKVLGSRGWKQEGVAFYGLGEGQSIQPPSSPKATVKSSGKIVMTNSNAQKGTFDVVVSNIVSSNPIKSVQVPVWTDQGGQDDLKWYTASRQSDGTYKVTVQKTNHKNRTGLYNAHLYYEYQNGKKEGIASTKGELAQPKVSGKISIQNNNQTVGTFDVIVSEVVAPNGLAAVQIPVWSEKNGQDDIVWYEAKKQANGTYKLTVQASNHGYDTGKYQAHLYLKQSDGSTIGVTSTSTTVTITQTKPQATIQVENTNNTYGLFDVVISDVFAPQGVKKISVKVWSEVNGQNDVKIYEAFKMSDGSYHITVRLANHMYEKGQYRAEVTLDSGSKTHQLGTVSTTVSYTKKTGQAFIDVSSHNGYLSKADYQNLLAQGITGVVVKLTEGTSYQNPFAADQIKNAQAAGLKVSVYHYSHFTTATYAQAEARYFVAMAKSLGLPPSTVMVNDIEEQKTRNNINANMKAWEAEMKRLGYSNLVHYTGASWVDVNSLGYYGPIKTSQFGIRNFWLAHYPYVNGMTIDKARELQYHDRSAAWQFTSKARLIVGRSFFDLNIDYTGRFTN